MCNFGACMEAFLLGQDRVTCGICGGCLDSTPIAIANLGSGSDVLTWHSPIHTSKSLKLYGNVGHHHTVCTRDEHLRGVAQTRCPRREEQRTGSRMRVVRDQDVPSPAAVRPARSVPNHHA